MSTPRECFYCDGTGVVFNCDIVVDGDFKAQRCEECDGTGFEHEAYVAIPVALGSNLSFAALRTKVIDASRGEGAEPAK